MSCRRLVLWCGLLIALRAVATHAAPPSESEMAARVDEHLATAWSAANVSPASSAGDAEFLRRAWLDLTGIIPPLNESIDRDGDGQYDEFYGVRGFLADPRPDKRERLIQHLLSKPTHARHFSIVWKNVMLPPEANVRQFGGDNGFQSWLFGQFKDNVPYDRMVREILLATGQANQRGPALFYTSLQLKPEELAASTSKIFLGVQIQCAQCHNHPFDHWTRQDFWGYAAFFARIQPPAANQQVAFQVIESPTGEVKLPETNEIVAPRFLDRTASADDQRTRRQRLAEWMTSADNPYFARATVNRVWGLLFGRGIVEPVDDLGQHNQPSHPELLDELSRNFVETGFDLRRLVRTLAMTRAYQLSSESRPDAEDRPEFFARMAIKSLTAEQLYDCLSEGMRRVESTGTNAAMAGAFVGIDQNRQQFLNKFRAPAQGATEFQSGIPQALTLMNGAMIRQATHLAQSDLLIALEAPIFSDQERVEVLFLSTLSRLPTRDERDKFEKYVQSGGPESDRRKALGDILWALLNSAEFALNH